MSGKTKWVKRLFKHKKELMSPVSKKVLFRYKIMPDITFHQRISNDLVQSKCFDPSVPSLIVFDISKNCHDDDAATDLFTIVVFIIQNLFFEGKQGRAIGVNAHHFSLQKIQQINNK